ncbi:glycosyltransferase family 4 protein [Rhizobium sp. Pop5]|uniref:glycosyltransferase family 4 protein n=2 Tax=Rhizobium sp. Pop5 TaxID=1223565 RepID=UPI002157B24F|nr:glycosyltransferase family 4 protein [Rhizobium sp. Pop5]UVD55924.1 glycosyltransferase family 4 protein [Rhizobium sp. Pop5]
MRPSLPDVLRSTANVSRFPGLGRTKIDRVVIIDDYSTARGGATALAVLSAKLFRGLDIPVTYICGDGAANAELAALGVSMVGLNSRDLLSAERAKAFVTGIHNSAAIRMVANWIAAKDTANTVYHVHGWHQILSPAIFRALAPVAARCVVHAHDFFTACPNGAFFDYQAQKICLRRPLGGSCIATACDKRSYSHKLWRVARGSNILRLLKDRAEFGRVILLHEKMAGFLVGAGYGPERLTTIRNPVAPLSTKRVEAEANDEFVFIGRLDEEKGVEDAIAATRRAGVRLCVIGDGPLMPLVQASGDHVRAVGWQSHAEIGPIVRKARALLMPSRYPEPFGLVAIEAARSGLPVIMSRSAFLAEEMERAGMALACDMADESAFADTLTRFSRMPEHEVRAMSERAFLRSPDLASTHEEWRDALLAEYHGLLSTNADCELTDGVAIEGVFS